MSPLWEGVREGCGSCAFGYRQVLPASQGAEPLAAVECRRFPPVLMYIERQHAGGPFKDVEQWNPTMPEDGWCGEWKRKDA